MRTQIQAYAAGLIRDARGITDNWYYRVEAEDGLMDATPEQRLYREQIALELEWCVAKLQVVIRLLRGTR